MWKLCTACGEANEGELGSRNMYRKQGNCGSSEGPLEEQSDLNDSPVTLE